MATEQHVSIAYEMKYKGDYIWKGSHKDAVKRFDLTAHQLRKATEQLGKGQPIEIEGIGTCRLYGKTYKKKHYIKEVLFREFTDENKYANDMALNVCEIVKEDGTLIWSGCKRTMIDRFNLIHTIASKNYDFTDKIAHIDGVGWCRINCTIYQSTNSTDKVQAIEHVPLMHVKLIRSAIIDLNRLTTYNEDAMSNVECADTRNFIKINDLQPYTKYDVRFIYNNKYHTPRNLLYIGVRNGQLIFKSTSKRRSITVPFNDDLLRITESVKTVDGIKVTLPVLTDEGYNKVVAGDEDENRKTTAKLKTFTLIKGDKYDVKFGVASVKSHVVSCYKNLTFMYSDVNNLYFRHQLGWVESFPRHNKLVKIRKHKED